jgi:hypothetical protein
MTDAQHAPGSADTRGMSRADAELYAAKQREFASEAGRSHREEYARKLHAKNLQLATSYLHRKGLWRIRLNSTCEILEVVSGAKGGPPVPGEFSFKATCNGEAPVFGSLSRLDATQTHYAETLIVDLLKVARARELAHQHQQACEAEGNGELAVAPIQQYLDSVTAKAGTLPPGQSELREARERQQALEAERRAAYLEAERRAALEALGVCDGPEGADGGLQDMIKRDKEKERKKAQKKARQKAKAARAALGPDGDAAAPKDATRPPWTVDEEVSMFERLLREGSGRGAGS